MCGRDRKQRAAPWRRVRPTDLPRRSPLLSPLAQRGRESAPHGLVPRTISAVGRPHCQQRPQGLDGGSTHLSCGHYSRPLGAREVRLFRESEQTETLEQTTYTPLFTVHTPVVDGGRTFGGARSGLDSNRPFAVGGLQQRWLSAARHVAFRGARRHGFI